MDDLFPTPQSEDAFIAMFFKRLKPEFYGEILGELSHEDQGKIGEAIERHEFAHMHCEIGAVCCR